LLPRSSEFLLPRSSVCLLPRSSEFLLTRSSDDCWYVDQNCWCHVVNDPSSDWVLNTCCHGFH
jgi:hypothetical protein